MESRRAGSPIKLKKSTIVVVDVNQGVTRISADQAALLIESGLAKKIRSNRIQLKTMTISEMRAGQFAN